MPKIIGGSLTAHREQTRHKLFAALTALMSERGFDAVTLADVATAAGMGRTAVYNHFADKEALLLAFITHETEQWLASLERSLEGVTDPVEQMRTYVRQHAQLKRVFHLAPGPDLRSVLAPSTAARLREHAEPVEELLRRILSDGMASGAFTRQPLDVTVRLVTSCVSGRVVPDGGPDREAALAATEAFVLRALGAAPA